jgi:hypothetical protein
MAWDSYDDEYHLTSSGWILAYSRPADALESWTLSVRQPYGWAPATRSWTKKWVKPGANSNMRAALHRASHGPAIVKKSSRYRSPSSGHRSTLENSTG